MQIILQRVPSNATIGAGDSLTLMQIGVFVELEGRGFTLFWPSGYNVAKEERREVALKALVADVFLSGSNALTIDGKIVNVDASGNKVAGMIFGP